MLADGDSMEPIEILRPAAHAVHHLVGRGLGVEQL